MESDKDDDASGILQQSVTHAQACDAFEAGLKWLEAQGNTDPVHLMLVKGWRDRAAVLRSESKKLMHTSIKQLRQRIQIVILILHDA